MKKISKLLVITLLIFLSANVAFAASIQFGNPINAQTVMDVAQKLMNYLYSVAAYIAIIFIVIGGVMYMLSAGNKEMMERGKKTLIYALAGLAIVVAAPVFLKEILEILGGPGSSVTVPPEVTAASKLQVIASRTLKLLLSIVGILAIIGILLGAIWMFTAGGDEDRYKLGKKTVIYAIVGIVIAAGALIIVQQITNLISGGGVPKM